MSLQEFMDHLLLAIREEFIAKVTSKTDGNMIIIQFMDGTAFAIKIES